MLISLNKIKQYPGAVCSFAVADAVPADMATDFPEFTVLGEIGIGGVVTNKGDGVYLLEGGYKGHISYACSRCLKDCCGEATGEVSSLYCENTAGIEDDEMDVRPLTGGQIAPMELILSSIRMDMPMQPLCREDCRGLCPICGIDLNKQACSCGKDIIDPRWEKLKDFKFTSDK